MTTADNPTTSPLYCPNCGSPLDTFQQRDYRVRDEVAYLTFATCDNPDCLLYHHTLSVKSLCGDLTLYEVAEANYDVHSGRYLPAWSRMWWYNLTPESESSS